MNIRTPFAALAILLAVSAPALAQQKDGGALTCAEYNSMNAADKNAAMNAVRNFAKESVNAEAAGTVAQMNGDDDVAFMGRMDASCVGDVGTATVIAAMQTNMTAGNVPALAQQIGAGALTCAEYNAMDAAGKNAAMGAIRAFAKESVNASAAGMVAQMSGDDDVAFMGRMDASCIDAVGTTPVIAAMQTTN